MVIFFLCAGAGEKSWSGNKHDRPLRTKGKRQAQKIGAWMGQNRAQPDLVLASTDLRTQVTAEKALKAGGWTTKDIQKTAKLSAAMLLDLSDVDQVLVVARRGDVRTLLGQLGLEPPLASGVLIEVTTGQVPTEARRIDPQDLPDHFPFPAPDGPERRVRPAYYYTQSAVIPYRQGGEGKEFLIVGSSSGRHWVVPKGIVEPGLSPAASALIEAREEAGVLGNVDATPLGVYRYEKWQATCRVTVFTMEVTELLSDQTWEESHRTRRWVTPAEAALLLNDETLRRMILNVPT